MERFEAKWGEVTGLIEECAGDPQKSSFARQLLRRATEQYNHSYTTYSFTGGSADLDESFGGGVGSALDDLRGQLRPKPVRGAVSAVKRAGAAVAEKVRPRRPGK